MTFQKFTGLQYLAIDLANNYGHDKWTWERRLNWFENNKHRLRELVKTADEPALFYAGIEAYEATLRNEPIGYMVSLDATSSGLQLLAALTGDRAASQLCNVVNTGNREDAYTAIFDRMVAQLGSSAKISRDDTKSAIMTSLYGSTAMPKQVFGDGTPMLACFYDTMAKAAPAAWELNQAFLQMWNPEALINSWVMPDNFHVHVKVMSQVKEVIHFLDEPVEVFHNENMPTEEGRSLGANTVHSLDGMIVREISRRCDYDPISVGMLRNLVAMDGIQWGTSEETEQDQLVLTLWDHYQRTGYLSARIIDVLNMDNFGHVDPVVINSLLESLPEKPFKVISIHDCFRCLPHYGNDLRKQYNLQLHLIAKSDILSDLISQIVGAKVKIGKLDPTLADDILDTNYALS